MNRVIAGTGHRPNKLGGYSNEVFSRLTSLAQACLEKYQPTQVISGMALGWDMALAQAALNLGVPLHASLPCLNQERKWPASSRELYQQILSKATSQNVISSHYTLICMQKRNEWMVDHCDILLALWNGTPGGTANCLNYAKSKSTKIINVWSSWEKYK